MNIKMYILNIKLLQSHEFNTRCLHFNFNKFSLKQPIRIEIFDLFDLVPNEFV